MQLVASHQEQVHVSMYAMHDCVSQNTNMQISRLSAGRFFDAVTIHTHDTCKLPRLLSCQSAIDAAGSIVLNRRADEEFLQILHVTKH